MPVSLILAPLGVALLSFAFGWRRWVALAGVGSSIWIVAAGIVLARAAMHGPVLVGGVIRVDTLSSFMVIVIGAVAVLSTWFAIPYVDAELAHGETSPAGARLHAGLVQVFVATMVFAVLASNLGMTWVAIEGTTIATAFLVGHRRTRASLEASWKYMVVGSVGIALAFLGTVLVYFAALHAGGRPETALDWRTLVHLAPRLDPGVMRLAIALLVLGYGTKVGLAPNHTWLPDAHSQAPAPVSALMSGVLLPVAFYALLRYKGIGDLSPGRAYTQHLFIVVGLLSLLVAGALLLAQRDYKRMLAYSSIEHMGLITLGAAAGNRLAIGGVLLHVIGHGLTKGVLFLGSGEILLREGTTSISEIHGLAARRPFTGGAFGIGLLALLGLPPFSLFASELAIFRGQAGAGLGWLVAIELVVLLVIFAAITERTRSMLLGASARAPDQTRWPVATPIGIGLGVCAALGVSAWPLGSLLHAASALVVAPR